MKPNTAPAYFRVLKQIQTDILKNVGKNFTGTSPPEIFVGEYNYPNVFSGLLAPITTTNSELLSSPESWYKNNFTVQDILLQRGSMIYSRYVQPVKVASKFTDIMQEVSMAKNPADINFDLKKKPTVNLQMDNLHAPVFNPAPLQNAKLENNISVAKRIDYITNDHHLKASDGLIDLYKHDFDITKINRILSAGLLGLKPQRKFVPTKWSITATDDTISKHLLENIKQYPWINDVELYHGEYLGNHFEILLLPRQWSYEVIEAKYSPNIDAIKYWQDYESVYNRKSYANSVVGAYYAVRLAAAEHLLRRKRQASVLVMRQIHNYDAPCGVGILREVTRDMLTKKPETFSNTTDAFTKAQTRMLIPVQKYQERSKLLAETKTQKSLFEYT